MPNPTMPPSRDGNSYETKEIPKSGSITPLNAKKRKRKFSLIISNGTMMAKMKGTRRYAPTTNATAALVEICVKSSRDRPRLPKPYHMGVPAAPNTVAKVLERSNTTTLSNLGWPSDISMGAPRATGVPNPDAPSTIVAKQKITHSSATPCPTVSAFISLIMYGKQFVASIVSNKQIAPAMMLNGVIASCTPFTTLPHTRSGSDPRYINRTSSISNADSGRDLVVGRGFVIPHGGNVATTRKIIGRRQNTTSVARPHGPMPSWTTAQLQDSHSASPWQV
mmetsp:Transcript_32319/g.69769  ORF Transcript_32319/g.69769 Transcript_32319/m.69769 type:complete len:279 (+) Transcript_32319:864-1700(+)